MERLIKVDAVEVFTKPIGGHFGPCPVCGSENVSLLGTTNEWKYRCESCRNRFNEKGVVLDDS